MGPINFPSPAACIIVLALAAWGIVSFGIWAFNTIGWVIWKLMQ